jgi:hypothetical protein
MRRAIWSFGMKLGCVIFKAAAGIGNPRNQPIW